MGCSMFGAKNPRWKGGRSKDAGRNIILLPDHPRANRGYVYEYIVIAEKASGLSISRDHPIHHVDEDPGNDSNSNLVICENEAYHRILHARTRILKRGGDPNTDAICRSCKEVKPRGEFSHYRDRRGLNAVQSDCKKCQAKRYAARAAAKAIH